MREGPSGGGRTGTNHGPDAALSALHSSGLRAGRAAILRLDWPMRREGEGKHSRTNAGVRLWAGAHVRRARWGGGAGGGVRAHDPVVRVPPARAAASDGPRGGGRISSAPLGALLSPWAWTARCCARHGGTGRWRRPPNRTCGRRGRRLWPVSQRPLGRLRARLRHRRAEGIVVPQSRVPRAKLKKYCPSHDCEASTGRARLGPHFVAESPTGPVSFAWCKRTHAHTHAHKMQVPGPRAAHGLPDLLPAGALITYSGVLIFSSYP